MRSPINIDFVNNIIIVNASYAKKASNPFSKEYAKLQQVRQDYPTFEMITRKIKTNPAKNKYEGLTYDYMRAYIMSHEDGNERNEVLRQFDDLLLIAQCHNRGLRYPTIKKWFLEKYPEITEFGMVNVFEVPSRANSIIDLQAAGNKVIA